LANCPVNFKFIKARLPYRYCLKNVSGYKRNPESVVAYSEKLRKCSTDTVVFPSWKPFCGRGYVPNDAPFSRTTPQRSSGIRRLQDNSPTNNLMDWITCGLVNSPTANF